jgi:ubiquinone/menaquinone biosynthesis C-methylase UbiE
LAQKQNRQLNQNYLLDHQAIVLPTDYDLYETYQLDYRKFVEDGALAAKEIVEWTKPYLHTTNTKILDWGCGTGRIVRHIPLLLPDAAVYACDINEQLIEWNRKNYRGISFNAINNFAPLLYAPVFFDLVYGISIFTHIEAERQEEWIAELYRILKYKGVLFVTTQGTRYRHKLLPWQQRAWHKKGIFTQNYRQKGHRMMSTYHTPEYFRKMVQPFFTVLAHYSGASHPEKAGGQDVWILQRQMRDER